MLAKLLSVLAATKGATVAVVIVLGAATVTVGASSPDVQDTVHNVVLTVTGQTTDQAKNDKNDCDNGQPAVVAQRNAATKLLDAAWQSDHKALEDMRGKGADNKAAGDLIKTADDKLKDLRTKALNDVAALTLGREGQNKPTGTPKPTKSPKPATVPCAAPAAETTDSATTAESPKTDDGTKPSEQGRVAVADRTTLDPNIKSIVDKAVADMDQVVKDATLKVGALSTPNHGKPSDNASDDHGKSSEPPALNPTDPQGGKQTSKP